MKLSSIYKVFLPSLFIFSFNYVAATDYERTPHVKEFSKMSVNEFHYSPLLDEQDPKKLINDWISLNETLQQKANSGDLKSQERLEFLRERQLRFLSNIGIYTRPSRTTTKQVFNREFVAFAEVCYFKNDTPEKIAEQFSVSDNVLKFYLTELNNVKNDQWSILKKRAKNRSSSLK